MALEIIIPIYNEACRLEGAVAGFARNLQDSGLAERGHTVRFWWADDGSTDGSLARLDALLAGQLCGEGIQHRMLRRERNQGKGSILRYAVEHARGEILPASTIAFWDADAELDSAALFEAFWLVNGGTADIVFGARHFATRSGYRELPGRLTRALANVSLTWFSNRFSGLRLSDVHCCARVARASVLLPLKFASRGFDFEAELAGLVGRVRHSGLKIREISIAYQPRGRGDGKKIGLRDVLPQLRQAVRCRFF